MGKKSKKHLKLDKAWIEFIINLSIGADLSVFMQKFPAPAELIFKKCVDLINQAYKEHLKEGSTGEEFISKAVTICQEVLNHNLTMVLLHFLEEGMPAEKVIVAPNSGFGRVN